MKSDKKCTVSRNSRFTPSKNESDIFFQKNSKTNVFMTTTSSKIDKYFLPDKNVKFYLYRN